MKIQSTSAILLVAFIAVMAVAPIVARKVLDLSKGMSFVVGWGGGLLFCIAAVLLIGWIGNKTNGPK